MSKHKPKLHETVSQSAAAEEALRQLFAQARAQFGDAIRSHWFYDGDLCPGCLRSSVGVVKFKGQDTLSLNAFIYRQVGVLIGYFLCEACALYIFEEAQKNPYRQTRLHDEIERNLRAAYHRYLAELDA